MEVEHQKRTKRERENSQIKKASNSKDSTLEIGSKKIVHPTL